jgi:CRP-like cAMP-binding protein
MSTEHWAPSTETHVTPRTPDRRPEWLRLQPSSAHELTAGASRELGDERELIYVADGRLLVSAVDDKGDEIVSYLRGPGGLVGLERLLDLVVPYQLWALTDVHFELVSIDHIKQWMSEAVTEPAKSLVRSALEATGSAVRERSTLHGRVITRVSKLLAEAQTGDGTLRLPRFVMARILSMRPETLSRAEGTRGARGEHPQASPQDREPRTASTGEHGSLRQAGAHSSGANKSSTSASVNALDGMPPPRIASASACFRCCNASMRSSTLPATIRR